MVTRAWFYFHYLLSVIFFFVLLFSQPNTVWADGFRNPFQSASATAQGAAFIAQADDPSAIHYNPAGITQLLGVQHAFGVGLVSPDTKFTNANGKTIHNDVSGGTVGLPPPGHFFLTGNFQNSDIEILRRVSIGLGVISLFGFANRYPSDSSLAPVITKAQLPVLDIKPTIAFKAHDMLSLGFGVDIFTFASFIGEGHAERQFIGLGNIPGTAPGDKLEVNGKGTTAGINASLLLTPLLNEEGKPLLNLGFVWRSQAVLPLEGELLANGKRVADSESSIKFPEIYEWGLAAWPIRDGRHEWKIEVDVHLVRWQTIRNFDIIFSNGGSIPQPQRWDNVVSVFVGTEFNWLDVPDFPDWELATRLGYIRSPTPIPDENFDPAVPDSDNHTFSVGFGFACQGRAKLFGLIPCQGEDGGWMAKKSMAIDLAYQYVRWDTRKVSGNPVPPINGTYKTRTHAGVVTLQVNF